MLERALVAYALMGNDISEIDLLPSELRDPNCRMVWQTVQDLYCIGAEVNSTSVLNALGEHRAPEIGVILGAQDFGLTSTNIPECIESIRSTNRATSVRTALWDLLNTAERDSWGPDEIISTAAEIFEGHETKAAGPETLSEHFDEFLKSVADRKANPERYGSIPTGFAGLNRVLPRGGLTVCGASTSTGKTSLATAIAARS
jgi:replicative DNA helicase